VQPPVVACGVSNAPDSPRPGSLDVGAECSRQTRGVEAGPTVEGDKDCYLLRRNTEKTANGWVLLMFFVDMRYACGTLDLLSLTAPLPMVVDAAIPEKAAAYAQASFPLRVSTPALPPRPHSKRFSPRTCVSTSLTEGL